MSYCCQFLFIHSPIINIPPTILFKFYFLLFFFSFFCFFPLFLSTTLNVQFAYDKCLITTHQKTMKPFPPLLYIFSPYVELFFFYRILFIQINITFIHYAFKSGITISKHNCTERIHISNACSCIQSSIRLRQAHMSTNAITISFFQVILF